MQILAALGPRAKGPVDDVATGRSVGRWDDGLEKIPSGSRTWFFFCVIYVSVSTRSVKASSGATWCAAAVIYLSSNNSFDTHTGPVHFVKVYIYSRKSL